MKNSNIIVSERNRPFWQIVIASLFFAFAFVLLGFSLYNADWKDGSLKDLRHNLKSVICLVGFGIGFSFQKSVYIDIDKSKFRSTFEIGPIKLGQWKTINNYEYVSVFNQPQVDGNNVFEVNLWYDKNKHWELYEKYDFEEAFLIGYKISEQLNIDLLDATIPNDYKWVDKVELKQNVSKKIQN